MLSFWIRNALVNRNSTKRIDLDLLAMRRTNSRDSSVNVLSVLVLIFIFHKAYILRDFVNDFQFLR